MISIQKIDKSFGAVQALKDVSMEIESGVIHGLLGENGAGKSTLMNILNGMLTPDSGSVLVDGVPKTLRSPRDARESGIEMVHQHFMLVPAFTVAENLALSNGAEAVPSLVARAADIGWKFDLNAKVSGLTVGAQQLLEITKCIGGTCRTLILDEPTAVLSEGEVQELFAVLRTLRDSGMAIVIIAHKLAEIMSISDDVTVLRRGEWVKSAATRDVTKEDLAQWMLGDHTNLSTGRGEVGERSEPGGEFPLLGPSQEVASPSPPGSAPASPTSPSSMERFFGEFVIDRANFKLPSFPNSNPLEISLSRGEILGVGGVDGNGQVDLAETLAGIRQTNLNLPAHTAYVPEDRHLEGLALNMSLEENMLITALDRPDFSNGPILKRATISEWASGLIQKFRVKTESAKTLARQLSGGNQQKVILGRCIDRHPDLLVLVNPTRGLDFNATRFVHEQISELASRGTGVVLISSDREELAQVATRTVYLSRGELTTTFQEALA